MPPLRSCFDICGAVLAHEAAGQSYLEFVKKALGFRAVGVDYRAQIHAAAS